MRLSRTASRRAAAALAMGAGLVLAGCASDRAPGRADVLSTGLTTLADPAGDPVADLPPAPEAPAPTAEVPPDLAVLAQQAALDLQTLLNEQAQPPAAELPAPEPPVEISYRPTPPTEGKDEEVPLAVPVVVLEPEAKPAEADDRPLDERIAETAAALVGLLRERAATSDDPVRAYLALASLEAVRAGLASDLATGGMVVGSNILLPSEWRAVTAFRDVAMWATHADSAGDPARLADLLTGTADKLNESRPMRIAAAAVCRRVLGYGQYEEFDPPRFIAGRAQPVIVYVEIEHFRNRPVRESDRSAATAGSGDADIWAIEVSQELNLYREGEPAHLVLRRPEQTVVETSRNKRREFFLVHEITLPATLAAGRYQLKITMRDKTSGAVDEAVVPFSIEADPSLLRYPGRALFD